MEQSQRFRKQQNNKDKPAMEMHNVQELLWNEECLLAVLIDGRSAWERLYDNNDKQLGIDI